jgi:hypothetical protein
MGKRIFSVYLSDEIVEKLNKETSFGLSRNSIIEQVLNEKFNLRS